MLSSCEAKLVSQRSQMTDLSFCGSLISSSRLARNYSKCSFSFSFSICSINAVIRKAVICVKFYSSFLAFEAVLLSVRSLRCSFSSAAVKNWIKVFKVLTYNYSCCLNTSPTYSSTTKTTNSLIEACRQMG